MYALITSKDALGVYKVFINSWHVNVQGDIYRTMRLKNKTFFVLYFAFKYTHTFVPQYSKVVIEQSAWCMCGYSAINLWGPIFFHFDDSMSSCHTFLWSMSRCSDTWSLNTVHSGLETLAVLWPSWFLRRKESVAFLNST